MIPSIDAEALFDLAHPAHAEAVAEVRRGATEIGFLTLRNTEISPDEVLKVIAMLRAFFHLPAAEKAEFDMARTGSNRGWGASGGEQVDPEAKPDYKQVYDCGFELDPADPVAALAELRTTGNLDALFRDYEEFLSVITRRPAYLTDLI